MCFLLLGMSCSALWPLAATAQDSPQSCATIKAPLQRLACFDTFSPEVQAAASEQSWHIEETSSPIDDSPKIAGVLLPKGSEKKIVTLDTIALGLRCHNNITSIIIMTGTSATSETAKISYTLNNNSAQHAYWERSANFLSVGLWAADEAIPFIKQLKNNSILTVKIDNPPVEAAFDLANVEALTDKISQACHWQ
ncbi:type VI secretion protein [Bacillus subtilis]|uniref:type VI secretion system-associated protein TagO n=1 Tax=Pseudochrobactrum asaccharolyticum TaxID=354351 RepID=UPI001F48D357|nr:type VI secretion system-associated protein TagO [Pseudochrobactrum asaccharolyticum]MCF7645840.1 type VI secretion protein [Pseudochrobactrum asaccharolyticum]MCF7671094.1 type VI secretion protein [Bacillus subtilis]